MLRIDVTGATWAYRAEGSGGDVLLFISRLNGRAAFWREQCQLFSQHFRCVPFDHRIGERNGARYTAVRRSLVPQHGGL